MIIWEQINKLYTEKTPEWMIELEDSEIEPFVIQRNLMRNDAIRVQVRWLDKYVFNLPPKMWLSLAWSVIPKTDKAPWIPSVKKQDDKDNLAFLFKLIRKHLELSDNDFASVKERLRTAIMNNPTDWFCFYGVDRSYWKEFNLDFNKIKEYNKQPAVKSAGLEAWGLA